MTDKHIGHPPPKDGTLIRIRLADGTIAAACWCENHYDEEIHPFHHGIDGPEFDTAGWVTFGLFGPPGACAGQSWIGHYAEEKIASWAPFARGAWTPWWDDLQDDLADVAEEPRDRWWIWQKNGHPPRFAWPTEEQANAEAQRLARRNPGQAFIVMHSTRKFRVEVPETEAVAP
jgi:hypothetical protein